MVTESPRATATAIVTEPGAATATGIAPAATAEAGELLAHVGTLRADADLLDGYARRLLATAATLSGCPAAPGSSPPALERQAAACTTAAGQLRTAAEALLRHAQAGD